MFQKVTTLTEFLLAEEQKVPNATGSFTLLMTQIENAAKIIASHVKKAGLVDIMGATGEKNAYEEEVQKLDQFSNDLLVDTLKSSGQVYAMGSEELEEPIFVGKNSGDYMVFFDPLDGSSNIDVNINVGTIFSIYHKNDELLQPGKNQVAAGYVLYGSSVMLVYSSGSGVHGFTLDPSIGSFLLSHPNMQIPKDGDIYSLNESYYNRYDPYLQNYIKSVKEEDKEKGKPYKMRYAAAMVADIHRILLKGGIFIYPENSKNPNGKLRLMYEVNPMSYLVLQAGGAATSKGNNPLDIIPHKLSERAPIALGSEKMVQDFLSYYNAK